MKKLTEFVHRLIRLSTHHALSADQVSSSYVKYFAGYFADKSSFLFFQRSITQEREITLTRKQIRVSHFS